MTPIIVAIRAPVLSATSSRERIWTINLFADDLDQAPPLQLAERSRFHDTNRVTALRLVFFVVRVKFLLLLHDFAELRVRHPGDTANDDRFVHRARNDLTYACLARTALRFGRKRTGGTRLAG